MSLFDLGKAMAKKEERESARLQDFAFAVRVRQLRLLAAWGQTRGATAVPDVPALALVPAEAALATLRALLIHPVGENDYARLAAAFRALAEAELRIERGDPSPQRLA